MIKEGKTGRSGLIVAIKHIPTAKRLNRLLGHGSVLEGKRKKDSKLFMTAAITNIGEGCGRGSWLGMHTEGLLDKLNFVKVKFWVEN